MASRNEQVYQMAQDWKQWLFSRRFLGQPPQKNILVALSEKLSTKGEVPDGPMSAEMAAFNLVINSVDDEYLLPFVAVYCDFRPKPIKAMADLLGIQAPAFYERAHATADKLYSQTMSLVDLHEKLKGEIKGYELH